VLKRALLIFSSAARYSSAARPVSPLSRLASRLFFGLGQLVAPEQSGQVLGPGEEADFI
jgi:hypothetical protein